MKFAELSPNIHIQEEDSIDFKPHYKQQSKKRIRRKSKGSKLDLDVSKSIEIIVIPPDDGIRRDR